MDGLDCLGAEDGWVGKFDTSALLNDASTLATATASAVQANQSSSKTSGDQKKALAASLAADIAAAAALAQADTSAPKAGRPAVATADIDAQAAKVATQVEDRAAAKLNADSQQKRADAADTELQNALALAQKNPKSEYQQALVKAWTTISNKAHNGAIAGTDDATGGSKGKHGKSDGSWFTRPVLGKVPGYGVVLGGAGILGGLGYAVKRFVMPHLGGK